MILRLTTSVLILIGPVVIGVLLGGAVAAQQWEDPFPPPTGADAASTDSLSLRDALQKVAGFNPTRQALRYRVEAAAFRIEQAGLRPNPEIGFEAEDFGGDLPGFSQAEFTAGLSQEIELWGKRSHRRLVAQSESDAVLMDLAMTDYDLYGETSRSYYLLVHAQNGLALAKDATALAVTMTNSVESRLEQGAAMISELLLSELELQRARLEQAQKEYELASAQDDLAALWGGAEVDLVAVDPGLDPRVLRELDNLQPELEKSREVVQTASHADILKAQMNLLRAENKPSLTVSGGYKRAQADRTNSFIFGLALPLPFFNRGQGNIRALQAEVEATGLDRQQAMISAGVEYRSLTRKLKQFTARRKMIHDIILPQAQETYRSLRQAYEKGKVIYSVLLQGEQTMIELRAELNDLDLALVEQVIALEQLLGVRLLQMEPK